MLGGASISTVEITGAPVCVEKVIRGETSSFNLKHDRGYVAIQDAKYTVPRQSVPEKLSRLLHEERRANSRKAAAKRAEKYLYVRLFN